MIVYTSALQDIILEEEPLGRGGQGNIYEVKNTLGWEGYVAKIYHPRERTKQRRFKLQYMWQQAPEAALQPSVVWVEELVYDAQQRFLGYLMRKAQGEINLTSLCSLSTLIKLDSRWQYHYHRETEEGLFNRMQVCQNLAYALHQLHQTQKYVLADIKPENIRVELNGRITLLDLDSVEIKEKGQLLFAADKVTNEYSPAEIRHLDFQKQPILETWDRFSMAIVFYKVLLGLHPFTGTCKPPYQHCVTYTQKIKEGLFPFVKGAKSFEVIPAPQKKFKYLPKTIQQLFIRCFEEGHLEPDKRPSALEWHQAFLEEDLQVSQKFFETPLPKKQKIKKIKKKKQGIKSTSGSVPVMVFTLFFILWVVWMGGLKKIEPEVYNPDEIEYIVPQNNGLQLVKTVGGKYGFQDAEGKEIIPYIFQYAEDFEFGLSKVQANDKWGFINAQGKEVIPVKFERVGNFNGEVVPVSSNKGIAFFNREGRQVTSDEYSYFGGWQGDIGKVKSKTGMGYIDAHGVEVIPCNYLSLGDFIEGLAMAFPKETNRGWGFIDTKGEIVIPFEYVQVHSFSQGLAAVQDLGSWGYINSQNQTVIPFEYDKVESFINGLAAVQKKDKWGFIDITGKVVIPFQYDKIIDPFYGNGQKARVFVGDDAFSIDRTGYKIP